MAKSKRQKVVPLTKTKKKGKDKKNNLIDELREGVTSHPYVYLLKLLNQKNNHLKSVRDLLRPGRVFCGKNRVMQVALGTEPSNEILENIHQLSQHLKNDRGVIVSSKPPKELIKLCDSVRPLEFARAGFVATCTVVLEEGEESLKTFPHSLEPELRKLGLPTLLKHGKILLMGNYTVCQTGQPLTPPQAQIIKLLGMKMAEFRAVIEGYWTKGEYTSLLTEDMID